MTNIYQNDIMPASFFSLASECLCESRGVEGTEYRGEGLLCLGELKGEEDAL